MLPCFNCQTPQVRTDDSAADSLAAACSWDAGDPAVRNAVNRLKMLWPDDELAEQGGVEQQQLDGGGLPPDLFAMPAAWQPPEQQPPEQHAMAWLQPSTGGFAPGWAQAASTPAPFIPTAATTPFGTAGAADLIAQMAQLPPLPFLLPLPSGATVQGMGGSHSQKRRRTDS